MTLRVRQIMTGRRVGNGTGWWDQAFVEGPIRAVATAHTV